MASKVNSRRESYYSRSPIHDLLAGVSDTNTADIAAGDFNDDDDAKFTFLDTTENNGTQTSSPHIDINAICADIPPLQGFREPTALVLDKYKRISKIIATDGLLSVILRLKQGFGFFVEC